MSSLVDNPSVSLVLHIAAGVAIGYLVGRFVCWLASGAFTPAVLDDEEKGDEA